MILARYLFKQLLPPLFFGLSVFSGVLLLDKVFDLIDLLLNKGVSFLIFLKMFLLFLPTVFSLTVPMSVLLACLLTFGRLSEDNEITAMRASGLSFRQILWTPMLLSAAVSMAMIPFNAVFVPKAMKSFRSFYYAIASSDPLLKIEPRRFTGIGPLRLYAREVNAKKNSLNGVLLYQFNNTHFQRIHAKDGTALVDKANRRIVLNLGPGQMEQFDRANQDFIHVKFAAYSLSASMLNAQNPRKESWRELNVSELTSAIRDRKSRGLPVEPLKSELHLRFAISFSTLALAFLGVPFGISMNKGSRGVGLGASLGIVFAYYLFLILGLALSDKGSLPALPALWMGNAIAVLTGAYFYRKKLRR